LWKYRANRNQDQWDDKQIQQQEYQSAYRQLSITVLTDD